MTKLNKRFLSALLAVILLLTNFPVVSAASDSFAIYYEGETVTEVEFYEHERITVSAEGIPSGTYQWQIQIPGTEQWVNIQGQTSQTINLSKAVVGSLMMNGSAYVRCAAISGGEEIDHTAALRTTVKKEEPAPQISAPPVVTAPAAKPTPAPTEPPVEATEAPTEPVVETEPVPEIAEPTESVEVPAESIEQTEPDAQLEVTAPVEEPVVEATDAPVEKAEPPVEVEEIPVETTAPTELESEVVATAPAEEPAVEATEAPVEKAETPVEVEEIPAETTAPAKPEEEVVATAPAEEPVVEATEAPAATETPAEIPTEPAEEKPAETFVEKVVQMLAPKANADGEPVTEFVTVEIQYERCDYIENADGNLVLSDNGQAFNPYVATLLAGSDLNTEVTFPTMVGYDTFVGDETTPRTSLELDLKNIQQDVIYVVKYMPAQVDYTVRYYFQNIYDDNYIEDASIAPAVAAKGATGFTPDENLVKAEFYGFTSLYYEPESIAADGSTVFEVYYERNYYLMEFDCNGGYGTDTLYVRFGTHIAAPQPVRTGYIFKGWDLVKSENPDGPVSSGDDAVDTLPATMPRYNSAYKAIWYTTQTTYTIVYWAENADDGYYSYWGTGSGNAESASTIIPLDAAKQPSNSAGNLGLTNATLFTLNETKTAGSNPAAMIVQGDGSTAINVYYSRNRYRMDFVYTGKCLLDQHTHNEDCYTYFCDNLHVHTKDCYVCGQIVHDHTSKCCSLFHTHSDDCVGACDHNHDITCYTTDSDVRIAQNGDTGYSAVKTNAGNSPTEGVIYRYRQSWNNYLNYIYISGTWYYVGTGNTNTINGLSWNGNSPGNNGGVTSSNVVNEPDTCDHAHDNSCYDCGKTAHTHAADETCNVEDCPNNGISHNHVLSCYLCGKTEVMHTSDCCSKEPHSHDGCPTQNCIHTVHDISCYSTSAVVASNQTGFTSVKTAAGSNPEDLKIYRYRTNSNNYHNYIYHNGTWYYLGTGSGNTILGLQWSGDNPGRNNTAVSSTQVSITACTHKHSVLCYSCGKTQHTHGDGLCDTDNCANPAHHIHSGSCYKCNTNHVHSNACNKSLTCIITEHTHTTNCNSTTRTNSIYSITAKYDADITQAWENPPIKTYLDQGNVWESSITGQYYSFLEKMPAQNITMTLEDWSDNSYTYTWHYCLEISPYENWTGETHTDGSGKVWKIYHTTTVKGSSNLSLTYEEDYFPITGYKQRDTNVPGFTNRTAYLYYTLKDDLTLSYYNRSDAGPEPPEATLVYGQPLKSLEISKEVMERDFYPAGIEPGAYIFAGWYTTQGFYPGSEMDWDEATMLDGNLEIYAKWVPVTHNVYFHSLYSDIGTGNYWYPKDENGSEIHIDYPIEVQHGALLGTTYSYIPDREDYTFVGWFYMDEDNKKRFAPDSMEIKEDLYLFAEWHSGIDTEYTVTYVLDKNTTIGSSTHPAGTEVAPPTSGHSSAGKTKTFIAKGAGELYEGFRENLFPTVNSHSILMDEDKNKNIFEFTYVHDELVYYQVRYVDYVSGIEILKSQIKESRNAIVTEKFLPKEGYVPLNFYIRKALVSDGDAPDGSPVLPENIITFYYTTDEEHGLYSIEYYQENAAGDYVQYESIVGSADLEVGGKPNVINVGDEFQIRPYEGYTYYGYKVITYDENGNKNEPTAITPDTNLSDQNPQGTLTYKGLTIQLYYKRNEYPYIIEYREFGTETVLKEVSDGSDSYRAKFDTEVPYKADKTLTVNDSQYKYYISDPTDADLTKSITIRAFEEGKNNPNKLIFYYLLKKVDVLYHVVYRNTSLTDLCYVSLASESATNAAVLLGSSAMPGGGFKFMGWYTDEACKTKVNDDWITTNDGFQHLKPGALNTAQDEVNYYALFEPIDLTVTYNANGGNEVPTVTSHIGETITLPPATRTGYTLLGWWYDADEDGTMDEGEEYAVGSKFTMPANDVTFIAQWIDSRLAPSLNVYVGINMSFYMTSSGDLYYNIPENEPAQIHGLAAARASYLETDRNAWYIQDWAWDAELPGKPTDYLEESVLTNGKNNGVIFGIADENGLKNYLKFENADYQNIVEVWLKECKNTNGVLRKNYSSANIDWEQLPDDPSKYEVVPYVIKLHQDAHPDVAGMNVNAWHIDIVIRPAKRCKVSYLDGLDVSYTGSTVTDDNEYGEGFVIQVANAPVATKVDGNTNCYAKFLGWYYDADNSGTIEEAEKTRLYQPGDKFTVPELNKNGQVIRFIGQWDYYGYLTISQTGMREGKNESGIYEVVNSSNAVIATVMITEKNSVTLEQVPVGDYTVREISSDWTWTYNPKVQTKNVSVVVNPGEDDNKVTFEQVAISPIDWLHSENHR